jgi:hypothetical protein
MTEQVPRFRGRTAVGRTCQRQATIAALISSRDIGSSLFFLTLYRAKRVQVVNYVALMEDETQDLNILDKYMEILHFRAILVTLFFKKFSFFSRKNNLFNLLKNKNLLEKWLPN